LDATREVDQFTGLNIVKTMNTGDTVTDRKNLTDFGSFGFSAEIGDLILKNSGDFRGADFHHATPFIASSSFCILARSEASKTREPTLTTRPPRTAGSTFRSTLTVAPTTSLRAPVTASICSFFSSEAEVTCAVTSPLKAESMER